MSKFLNATSLFLVTLFSWGSYSNELENESKPIAQQIEEQKAAEAELVQLLEQRKVANTHEMILWLCTTRYSYEQKSLGVNWGNHPILKSPDKIVEIAKAVDLVAQKTGLDTATILTISWFESRFNADVLSLEKTGKLGELGPMQVHGKAARKCDLTTLEGQFECGSKWFLKCLDDCQDWSGAIAFYATGNSCRFEKSNSVGRLVNNRLVLKQQLESLKKADVVFPL